MARNDRQEITIYDRAFTIKKFTPETGCYWATKLLGRMTTLKGNDFAEKIQDFTDMDKKQFREFQRDCLERVFYRLDGGESAPFMNSEGFLTIPDIMPDAVFELTIRSFMFSIVDFFSPDLLQRLGGAVRGAMESQVVTPESMNSSTPQ